MINSKLKVIGKVQGVWFRDYVRKSASKLYLNGWVKNEIDGSVIAEVEGEKPVIEKLIEKIKIGSPFSKVEKVDVEWIEFEEKYRSFKIIR